MKKLIILVVLATAIGAGAFYYIGYGNPEQYGVVRNDNKGNQNTQNVPEINSSAKYACAENKTFTVGYGEKTAEVALGTSKYTLEQIDSEFGLKYANEGEEVVFWSQDDIGYIAQGGEETYSECILLTKTGGDTEIVEASLYKKIAAKNISITLLEVIEDSRCPIDVVCMQAGTVRARARITTSAGNEETILGLNEAFTSDGNRMTLLRVLPATRSSSQISLSNYRFYLEISKIKLN